MRQKLQGTKDPDILGSYPALKRAARRALELGLQTNTPVWVIKDGKIVDRTIEERKRRRAAKSRRRARRRP